MCSLEFSRYFGGLMANRDSSVNQASRTTVVGIGASAGGVKALGALLDGLPADTGAAFVVIMHLAPQSHSDLPHILAGHTKMAVAAVTAPMPLRADHIYVIPPDRQLQISDSEI